MTYPCIRPPPLAGLHFANLQINVKPPNVVFRKNLEI